ncbi:MAG: hypothetical protein HN348_18520, partial [Proteobacteria bacterium]|nr:hypothetical protein [Pseudomonadota bacterium]
KHRFPVLESRATEPGGPGDNHEFRGRRATEADSKHRFPVLESRATEPGGPGDNSALGWSIQGSIIFEPWFFYVPHEVYVEHGNQYDLYTSFRYLLWPVVKYRKQEVISLPMGNLSNRYLMSRMGHFNPHSSEYILNLFRYVRHWFKYYALTRRGLLFPWLFGSIKVVTRSLWTRRRMARRPPEYDERLSQVADRLGLDREQILALAQLQRRPITQRFYRLLRELWIDRVIIALAMTSGTIVLALMPIQLWIKLMVPLSSFPLLYFIYEWLAQGESIFTIEQQIPKRAREVSQMLPVRLVSFGHTHVPRQIPLSRKTTFVDTGAWAPMTRIDDKTRLTLGMKNYLLANFDNGEMCLEFSSRMDNDEK